MNGSTPGLPVHHQLPESTQTASIVSVMPSNHPKGDQSWVFLGGTDVEAETPILWPPDAESWLIWKDPDAIARKEWESEVLYLGVIAISVIIEVMGMIVFPEQRSVEEKGKVLRTEV